MVAELLQVIHRWQVSAGTISGWQGSSGGNLLHHRYRNQGFMLVSSHCLIDAAPFQICQDDGPGIKTTRIQWVTRPSPNIANGAGHHALDVRVPQSDRVDRTFGREGQHGCIGPQRRSRSPWRGSQPPPPPSQQAYRRRKQLPNRPGGGIRTPRGPCGTLAHATTQPPRPSWPTLSVRARRVPEPTFPRWPRQADHRSIQFGRP